MSGKLQPIRNIPNYPLRCTVTSVHSIDLAEAHYAQAQQSTWAARADSQRASNSKTFLQPCESCQYAKAPRVFQQELRCHAVRCSCDDRSRTGVKHLATRPHSVVIKRRCAGCPDQGRDWKLMISTKHLSSVRARYDRCEDARDTINTEQNHNALSLSIIEIA